MVRHPCDFKAWQHVHDNVDPTFGEDVRKCPYGTCSRWSKSFQAAAFNLVYVASDVFNYNIPPWLTTKNFFCYISLTYSRKTVSYITLFQRVFGTISSRITTTVE